MIVPADGVKGKTWGPSSGGHVLNSLGGLSSSKSRPAIPEERWSQSVSSLEKSSRSKSGMPSVTSVPEIGNIILFFYFFIFFFNMTVDGLQQHTAPNYDIIYNM